MSSTTKLLPCPFCSNADISIKNENPNDNSGGYFIECPGCGASTSLRFACGDDPTHLLAEQWNRRTASHCLHQIQEPDTAEQAAWHAGLDEGRAQAAPAAVAVPDAVRDAEKLLRAEAARLERIYSGHGNKWYGFSNEKAAHIEHLRVADALAATPAAPAGVAESAPITFMTEVRAREWAWDKVREEVGTQSWTAGDSFNFHGFYLWGWNYRGQYELQRTTTRAAVMQEIQSAAPAAAAPVVLPEPVAFLHTLHDKQHNKVWFTRSNESGGVPVFTEQQLRALLAQKIAIMPKGESAAAQLRAMATNYPTGHSWDKLDAKACIRGALEIEGLRAQQATATGLPAQAVPDGWKLVPVKLTEKMRCAGEVVSSPSGNAQYGIGRNALALAWMALLDAAPTPPKATDAAPQAQADARDALTPAARDVLAERQRQITQEGYGPQHDDEHSDGSLSIAAACYALANVSGARPGALSPSYLAAWVGWGAGWFKPSDRRRNLEKACALLLADMERIDRAAIAAAKGE